MKRLAVIHYPFFGGPHNQALRLARPLRSRNVETTVVLPRDEGNAQARLRAAGVDVIECPLSRLRAQLSPAIQVRYAHSFAADVRRLLAA